MLTAFKKHANKMGLIVNLKKAILRAYYQYNKITTLSTNNKSHINNTEMCIIRHFAATGGSLVAKLIRDNSNGVVVSEIDPFHLFGNSYFSPTNFLSQLASANGVSRELIRFVEKQHLENLRFAIDFLQPKKLVVRDWSHGYYFERHVLDAQGNLKLRAFESWTKAVYNSSISTSTIVTVRHPVESYISALKYSWVRVNLDEYCMKYNLFLDDVKDFSIYRYEDICNNPQELLEKMCASLGLQPSSKVIPTITNKKISGDSGRSSQEIKLRCAKNISKELWQEMNESEQYSRLCKRLSYLRLLKSGSTEFTIELP